MTVRFRRDQTEMMRMSRWLVTGGAGYIGSHVVQALGAAGDEVVVLDDLTTGSRSRVDVPLVVTSLSRLDEVRSLFDSHAFDGVIHLAANKRVDESTRDPLLYYARNIGGLVNLLTAMSEAGVPKLIYSSSAAVYGTPRGSLVDEDAPTVPENAYGETKLVGEWLVRRQAQASGLRYVALRYFNVAGTGDARFADRQTTNLIPIVLAALRRNESPQIFGDDFPTDDGTCVRDFIHVSDLARAHLDVMPLLQSPDARHVFNVGRGHGYSVRQVIEVACEVTGSVVRPLVTARRAGDPARVVADPRRLMASTGWHAQHDLRDMIVSASSVAG